MYRPGIINPEILSTKNGLERFSNFIMYIYFNLHQVNFYFHCNNCSYCFQQNMKKYLLDSITAQELNVRMDWFVKYSIVNLYVIQTQHVRNMLLPVEDCVLLRRKKMNNNSDKHKSNTTYYLNICGYFHSNI